MESTELRLRALEFAHGYGSKGERSPIEVLVEAKLYEQYLEHGTLPVREAKLYEEYHGSLPLSSESA